jgi:uncharacterized protein YbaR (Trm112 family)
MSEASESLPISADLLAILRDPKAVQQPEQYGPDPGRLELVHNSWLVSKDTGYKYPIVDGIPVMLVEEGARWKDTPLEALPVPPQMATSEPLGAPSGDRTPSEEPGGGVSTIALVAGLVIGGLLLFLLWRRWFGRGE